MRLKGCGHVQVSVVAAVVSESVPVSVLRVCYWERENGTGRK